MSLNINQNHSGVGHNIVKESVIQEKTKKNWFSMNNPIVWLVVSLILAALVFNFFR